MSSREEQLAGSCRSLDVWVAAMDLAECVYQETKAFPEEERFGLTSQLRRSSAGVVANISEGTGRRTVRDFAQFLAIARGSLRETETLWLLARRVGLASESERLTGLCIRVGEMLTRFLQKLDPRPPTNDQR